MALCRYFQNGTCRYGQSCRFEHAYEGQGYGYHNYSRQDPPQYEDRERFGQNRSSVVNRLGGRAGDGQRENQAGGFNFSQTYNQVTNTDKWFQEQAKEGIEIMLAGKQYLFSCIPASSDSGNFAHLNDLSPDEIHLKAVESLNNNTIQQYQTEMSSHRDHVQSILREVLRDPRCLESRAPLPLSSTIIQHSPLTGPQGGFSPQQLLSSDMASAMPSSIFAPQNVASLFPGSPTGPSPPPPAFPSASIAFPSSTAAFPTSSTSSPQTQLAFPIQTLSTSTPQAAPAPVAPTKDSTVYSTLSSLSQVDLQAFQNDTFCIETIPLVPPPRELCFP